MKMRQQGSHKLASLFFVGCAMVMAGFAHQLLTSNPPAHAGLQPRQPGAAVDRPTVRVSAPDGPISLQVDQAVLIGRSRIVFRGLADDRVRFDHYLLDFNPRYAFKYEVPVDDAKDGFAIGTLRMRVTYAGGDWVHFRLVAPERPS